MKQARVFVHGVLAGALQQMDKTHYRFTYEVDYAGQPVSLTMPICQKVYDFEKFPSFFEGLLPEGDMLQALLRQSKLDRHDYFSQLMKVGKDVVGAVTVEEVQ